MICLDVHVRGSELPELGSHAALGTAHAVALVFDEGAAPPLVEPILGFHRSLQSSGRALVADLLLAADADAILALGGEPTSLSGQLELSRQLVTSGVPVRWRVPLVEPLAFRLEAIFSLALDEGIDPILVRRAGSHLQDPERRRFVEDFVAGRLLDEDAARWPPSRIAWYHALKSELGGASTPAARRDPVSALERDQAGQWQLREEVRDDAGALSLSGGAAEGETVSPAGGAHREPVTEIAGVIGEGLRAVGEWARTAATGRARAHRPGPERTLPTVLVIGAYGGDHIGDAAIVGGVLLRMHRRYRTQQAILVSQRPAHTARLAAMLDTPVTVRVEAYQQSTIPALLAGVDGVVFAGGPLMDLPKQLVKHLFTVARARRAGKPFVIEGIGAGPFIRQASASTARLLVRMAERITVRTALDARQPLVSGLDPIVGRDPAFDYLETRGTMLTRLADADRRSLQELFDGTTGRLTVGINLRPLRPDYTVGAPPTQRAEYTREVESRFEAQLAEAMIRVHASRPQGQAPCFIFYPMNAIQFGSSDLRSAYRLKRLLGKRVDFRIWQGDPSIDGVIALLRLVNVAITMRFHATIYAVSQRTAVIGVDYRPGKKDKVAALLDDLGEGHNCTRIDLASADWLVERMGALSAPLAGTSLTGATPRNGESTPRPVQPPAPI